MKYLILILTLFSVSCDINNNSEEITEFPNSSSWTTLILEHNGLEINLNVSDTIIFEESENNWNIILGDNCISNNSSYIEENSGEFRHGYHYFKCGTGCWDGLWIKISTSSIPSQAHIILSKLDVLNDSTSFFLVENI